MSERRERVDLYTGPGALWRFLKRNRRLVAFILACGVLLLFGFVAFGRFWLRGCGGTDAARAFAADLRDDPLMAALPPGATSAHESTAYACPRGFSPRTVGRPPLRASIEITKQSRLARPMSTADLHQYLVMSVGLTDWRLIATDEQSLSYCRLVGSYRVVSLMTLDDMWLTNQILAWIDGRPCAPEIASPP